MRQKVEMDKKGPFSFKVVATAVIVGILLLAHLSIPSEETMTSTINGEIKEAIAEVISNDNDVAKVTEREVEKNFMYYNILEYKECGFFSVMNIIGRYSNESSVGMIGVFGMPITVADLRSLVVTDTPDIPQKKQKAQQEQQVKRIIEEKSEPDLESVYTGHDYNIGKFDDSPY